MTRQSDSRLLPVLSRLKIRNSITTALTWAVVIAFVWPVARIFGEAFWHVDAEKFQHFAAHLFPKYAVNSVIVAAIGIITGVTVGFALAWTTFRYEFPLRKHFAWLAVLPFAMPAYVAAYAYVDFFQVTGPFLHSLRAWTADSPMLSGLVQILMGFDVRNIVVCGLLFGFTAYPYCYLAASTVLMRESGLLYDAASTLGAGEWRVVRRLALPLTAPAVFMGSLFIGLEVLNDFGAVDHFAIDTFATGIYRTWSGSGDLQTAVLIATVFFLFAAAILWGERRFLGRKRLAQPRASAAVARRRLPPLSASLAVCACSVPVVFGFLLPVAILVGYALGDAGVFSRDGVARSFGEFAVPLLQMAANSSAVAVTVAIVSGLIALVVLQMDGRARWVVTLGYAMPGAFVAVALMHSLPIGLGLLTMLVLALTIRFVSISLQDLKALSTKIPENLTAAAQTLGASPQRVFFRVQLPLLRPALVSGALLVFTDALKELPATMVLRPFDFPVLTVHIHNFASDERLGAAAPAALILVMMCVPGALFVFRSFGKFALTGKSDG